jgi:glycosyltransferase involved in cell wall biosynthesis
MISVIISTYNRAQLLEGCLRSLTEQVLPSRQFEVIVVNNNCTDNTSAVVAHAAQAGLPVREVLEPTQGLSPARNSGARAAQGEVLAFLDDDAVALPGWLSAIELAFRTTPALCLLGGPVNPKFTGAVPRWLSGDLLLGFFALRTITDEGLKEISSLGDLPYGCNFIVKTATFFALGMFDIGLGRVGRVQGGGEDIQFGLKVRYAGGMIAVHSQVAIDHYNPPEKANIDYVRENAYSSCASLRRCLAYLSKEEITHLENEARRMQTRSICEPARPYRREALESFVTDARAKDLSLHLAELEEAQRSELLYRPLTTLDRERLNPATLLKDDRATLSEQTQKAGQIVTAILERDILQGKSVIVYADDGNASLIVAAAIHGANPITMIVKNIDEKERVEEALKRFDFATTIIVHTNDEWLALQTTATGHFDFVLGATPFSATRWKEVMQQHRSSNPACVGYFLIENQKGYATKTLAARYGLTSELMLEDVSESEESIVSRWLESPTFEKFQANFAPDAFLFNEVSSDDSDIIEIAPMVSLTGLRGDITKRFNIAPFFQTLSEVERSLPASRPRMAFCRDYVNPLWFVRVE